jgi:hypothetical protein
MARTCINNENKRMKYDSMPITMQPLKHLTKFQIIRLNPNNQRNRTLTCNINNLTILVPGTAAIMT